MIYTYLLDPLIYYRTDDLPAMESSTVRVHILQYEYSYVAHQNNVRRSKQLTSSITQIS